MSDPVLVVYHAVMAAAGISAYVAYKLTPSVEAIHLVWCVLAYSVIDAVVSIHVGDVSGLVIDIALVVVAAASIYVNRSAGSEVAAVERTIDDDWS